MNSLPILSLTVFSNHLTKQRTLLIALLLLCTNTIINAQWLEATSNTTQTLMSVEYGAGQWVAVGNNGTIVTSTDGMIWTPRISNTIYNLHEVRYNAGQWVSVGDNGIILTSSDGIVWTSRTSNTNQSISNLSYSGTKWVTKDNTYGNQVLTSTDGITWTTQTLPISAYDVASGDGKWVAATGDGFMTSLNEGSSWKATASGFRYPLYKYINYKNGQWMGADYYVASVFTSSDGINWKGSQAPYGVGIGQITYGGGKWMVVTVGALAISVAETIDYITWGFTYNNPSTHWLNNAGYGGGLWVAVGESGAILYNANPTVLPLPTSLVSFQGENMADDIQLTWETAWEKGASHFLIERSTDAKSFEAVGRVKAHETTTLDHYYSFLDKDLYPSIWYYRLRQVDLDGSYTYSQIIAIRTGAEPLETLTLSPNPSAGPLLLEHKKGLKSVEIYSTTGALIEQREFSQSIDHWSWTAASQPAGVYIIQVLTQDGQSRRLRWVKR